MDIIILAVIFIAIAASVYFISMSFTKQEMRLPQEQQANAKVKVSVMRNILRGLSVLIKPLERFLPAAQANKELTWAGSPLNILEFFAFKGLMVIVIPIIGVAITKMTDVGWLIGFIVAGYFIPNFWLKQKIKKRQRKISRDLPAVIDLMSLCVGAGLNFMLAMDRVIKEFKRCPLTEELAVTWHEIQMGRTRQEALKSLAQRVGVAEISSFVRTLNQADRMGSPIGEALKILSDEIRTRRFLLGEELALKAPIKLLFPLLIFILPVVLIIVGGPVILQFLAGSAPKF